MLRLRRWAQLATLLGSGLALADPYDFLVYRLGQPAPVICEPAEGGCNIPKTSGQPTFVALGTPGANAAFRSFARELAAALTSVNLSPPETLGHSGFAVNAELSVVQWKTAQFAMPTEQAVPSSVLVPSVHLRKGLPFSFEVGTRTGWIEKSRMAVGTLEVKWALNEGFTYLPDLGVRGYGTRLFNTRDFYLTAAGLDIGLGKQFAVGGMITLYPYAGWNLVWVSATSGIVDFRPSRTNEESMRSKNSQLQDTTVFEDLGLGANQHSRVYGGLRFIGGVVQIGAEVSLSRLGKFHDATTDTDVAMPDLLTVNFTLGLDF